MKQMSGDSAGAKRKASEDQPAPQAKAARSAQSTPREPPRQPQTTTQTSYPPPADAALVPEGLNKRNPRKRTTTTTTEEKREPAINLTDPNVLKALAAAKAATPVKK